MEKDLQQINCERQQRKNTLKTIKIINYKERLIFTYAH